MHNNLFRLAARATLLRPRLAQKAIGLFEFSPTEQTYGIDQAASGVADFFVKVFVPIEIVVAGRIGLIVTQVAVEQGSATGRDQSHIRQPIGEAPHPKGITPCISPYFTSL